MPPLGRSRRSRTRASASRWRCWIRIAPVAGSVRSPGRETGCFFLFVPHLRLLRLVERTPVRTLCEGAEARVCVKMRRPRCGRSPRRTLTSRRRRGTRRPDETRNDSSTTPRARRRVHAHHHFDRKSSRARAQATARAVRLSLSLSLSRERISQSQSQRLRLSLSRRRALLGRATESLRRGLCAGPAR